MVLVDKHPILLSLEDQVQYARQVISKQRIERLKQVRAQEKETARAMRQKFDSRSRSWRAEQASKLQNLWDSRREEGITLAGAELERHAEEPENAFVAADALTGQETLRARNSDARQRELRARERRHLQEAMRKLDEEKASDRAVAGIAAENRKKVAALQERTRAQLHLSAEKLLAEKRRMASLDKGQRRRGVNYSETFFHQLGAYSAAEMPCSIRPRQPVGGTWVVPDRKELVDADGRVAAGAEHRRIGRELDAAEARAARERTIIEQRAREAKRAVAAKMAASSAVRGLAEIGAASQAERRARIEQARRGVLDVSDRREVRETQMLRDFKAVFAEGSTGSLMLRARRSGHGQRPAIPQPSRAPAYPHEAEEDASGVAEPARAAERSEYVEAPPVARPWVRAREPVGTRTLLGSGDGETEQGPLGLMLIPEGGLAPPAQLQLPTRTIGAAAQSDSEGAAPEWEEYRGQRVGVLSRRGVSLPAAAEGAQEPLPEADEEAACDAAPLEEDEGLAEAPMLAEAVSARETLPVSADLPSPKADALPVPAVDAPESGTATPIAEVAGERSEGDGAREVTASAIGVLKPLSPFSPSSETSQQTPLTVSTSDSPGIARRRARAGHVRLFPTFPANAFREAVPGAESHDAEGHHEDVKADRISLMMEDFDRLVALAPTSFEAQLTEAERGIIDGAEVGDTDPV